LVEGSILCDLPYISNTFSPYIPLSSTTVSLTIFHTSTVATADIYDKDIRRNVAYVYHEQYRPDLRHC